MLKCVIWTVNYISLSRGINIDISKFGGLHENHAVATWNFRSHLIICLKTETKKIHVEGPSGCILTTSSQQSSKQKMRIP